MSFPSGITSCPNDGSPLVEIEEDYGSSPPIEPTESIAAPGNSFDVVPSRSGMPVRARASSAGNSRAESAPSMSLADSDMTRAERPHALARGSSSEFHSRASGKKTPTTSPPQRSRRSTEPGRRIGQVMGNYRLVDILGQGGMGCVYQAEHIKLGRSVALKLLRADHAERRDAVARFFQEARAVNKIRHRNIVDVTDFVELDDGTTFIIMELLDGISLGKLARSGNLSLPRALAILIQICDGLAAAHSVGIIHRDLKPDNVIVVPTRDGADLVKLLDFGVAKLLVREEDEEDFGFETAAGAVVGTPTFMSPEQAGGLDVDARSDIYSLGAIMYEVFCGEPVFRGRSFGEFVRKHLSEKPVRPSHTRGGRNIDDRLEAMIMKCLEKDPLARYQEIDELRDELTFMLAGIETSIENIRDLPDSGQFRAMAPRLKPITLPPSTGLLSSDPGTHPRDTTPGATPLPSASTGASSSPALGPRWIDVDRLPGASQNPVARAAAVPPTPPPWPAETALALGDLPARHPGAPAGEQRRTGLIIGVIVSLAAMAALAVILVMRTGEDTNDDGADGTRSATDVIESSGPTVTPMHGFGSPEQADEASTAPTVPGGERITVRMSSTPSAAVYAAGASEPLCTTPCDLTIVRNDRNSPGKRTYELRRRGYRSETVHIDLQKPPRTVETELRRQRTHSSSTAQGRDKPEPSVEPVTKVEKVETDPTDKPEPTEVEPENDREKPEDKIDPSVTLDPFGPQ